MSARQCTMIVAFICLVAGCFTHETGRPPLVPVTGSVFVDGKPATGAMVSFHPTASVDNWRTQCSYALVEADGSFRAFTFNPGDGVPVGDYRLTVVWTPVRPGGDSEPDRLRGRYSDPKSPVATIMVGASGLSMDPLRLSK